MPEYQLGPRRVHAVPAGPASQAGRPVSREHRVGLRPSQVRAWPPLSGLFQTKLPIGAAEDRGEQEADRVADSVMWRLRTRPATRRGDEAVRADLADAGQQHEPVPPPTEGLLDDRAGSPDGHSAAVQVSAPQPGGRAGTVTGDAGAAILRAVGGGEPLTDAARTAMEEGFGADFSGVRMHRDAAAHDLSRELHAAAFTVGRDVFLPPSAPSLTAPAGQRLLAHELAHVLQQGAGQAVAPLIQRQRDLDTGDSVEFLDDSGNTCWGTVIQRTDTGTADETYRVEDDESGNSYVCDQWTLYAITEGDPLEPGTKVRAQPGGSDNYRDCTIKEVIPPGEAEQTYDINLEWEEGWQLPYPSRENGIAERKVHTKNRNDFKPRALKTAQQVEIEHFYPSNQGEPNAAEYVKPGSAINITSHALGSGIYGFSRVTSTEREEAKRVSGDFSTEKFKITNPLVVQNFLHGTEVQELGKMVNGVAQQFRDERELGKGTEATRIKELIGEKAEKLERLLARVFGRAGLKVPVLDQVEDALIEFFRRYDDPKSTFVDQPVTIFLAELCKLGGVYGDADSGINIFSMGNVAFVPPDQKIPRKVRPGKTNPEWVN